MFHLIFYSIFGPLKLENGDFCHFLPSLKGNFSRSTGKKIKVKKIAAYGFKKSVSRVSIPKIRVLAQISRPLYLLLKSKLTITYISKCAELPIYFAIRQEKYHRFSVERNILLLQKVCVSRRVGAKHILKSQK